MVTLRDISKGVIYRGVSLIKRTRKGWPRLRDFQQQEFVTKPGTEGAVEENRGFGVQ